MPRSLLLVSAAVAALSSLPAQQRLTPPPPAVDVDATFAAALPPPAESRWTLIPWRHSLTDAIAEAKALQRPVYLYVNDGDVGSARC